MNTRPISPIQHGIDDYVFAAIHLIAPPLLKLDKATVKTHRMAGVNLLANNALTDLPTGVAHVIPLHIHRVIDIAGVTNLVVMTMKKDIRKNKKALLFHLGVTALAALHIVATNWKGNLERR